MNLDITEIKHLGEVDFQSLFEGSFPDIDVNYYANAGESGYSDTKRDSCLQSINDIFQGRKTPANSSVFAFKVTINGVDSLLNVGFINTATNIFESVWMLSKPHEGSRAFINSTEYVELRKSFLKNAGVLYYCIKTIKNSVAYKSIKRNNSLGTIRIVEESILSIDPGSKLQIVRIVFIL